MSAAVSDHPAPVGAERGAPVGAEGGDEDVQHTARHQRLAARLGAERERVGQHDDRHDRQPRQRRPTGAVEHGRHGGAELLADEAGLEAEQVPRRPRREHRVERRAVALEGDQPHQEQHDGRHRDPSGDAPTTQRERCAVTDDDDGDHVVGEVPARRTPSPSRTRPRCCRRRARRWPPDRGRAGAARCSSSRRRPLRHAAIGILIRTPAPARRAAPRRRGGGRGRSAPSRRRACPTRAGSSRSTSRRPTASRDRPRR